MLKTAWEVGSTYLTRHHVIEHALHGLAVRQRALPRLAVGLALAALTLVRVQQQHQLLLDQLALLRVRDGPRVGLLRGLRRRRLRRRLRLRLWYVLLLVMRFYILIHFFTINMRMECVYAI